MEMPVKKVCVPSVTIMVFNLKLEMIQPLNAPSMKPNTMAIAKPASGLVSHQPLFKQIVTESEYANDAIAGNDRSKPPEIMTTSEHMANMPSTTSARVISQMRPASKS